MSKKIDAGNRPATVIVSSEHLASQEGWRLSELEYGLIISYNAFTRWMTRCMTAAGYRDFNPLEVLVLHNVNHRQQNKRLVDICFMLNIEDQHTVNYALKKLVNAGLVKREKRGKEIFYGTTIEGRKACERYRDIRERCLVATHQRMMERSDNDLTESAEFLRLISGLYDQASRAASSLT